MGGIHRATQSFIILLVFALFKSHHHAKVPKEQDWPNSKLGLDCSSNRRANPSSHQCDFHILDLLCWPPVVLCRRRGSCPDLGRKQLHGLSVSFLIQCLKHPNPNWSLYPRTWTLQGSQKCSGHGLPTQFSLPHWRVTILDKMWNTTILPGWKPHGHKGHYSPKGLIHSKGLGLEARDSWAMFRELKTLQHVLEGELQKIREVGWGLVVKSELYSLGKD